MEMRLDVYERALVFRAPASDHRERPRRGATGRQAIETPAGLLKWASPVSNGVATHSFNMDPLTRPAP